MKPDTTYGPRSARHQEIMGLDSQALHTRFPGTATVVFNETMKKKEFSEKLKDLPEGSYIVGDKEGKLHGFVVGNESGEILPKVSWRTAASL